MYPEKSNESTGEKAKRWVVKHRGLISIVFGTLANVATLSSYVLRINQYVFGGVLVALSTVAATFLWLYLRKTKDLRRMRHRANTLLGSYGYTHHSWHKYNELQDDLYLQHELTNRDELLATLVKHMNSNLAQLKKNLQELHENGNIFYSFKLINYAKENESYVSLEEAGKRHKDGFFSIIDLDLMRDSMSLNDPLIPHLVFDDKARGPHGCDLRESLFYQAVTDSCTKIQPTFTEMQRTLVNGHYLGGAVSPVMLFGYPAALICLGTTEGGVLEEEDKNMIDTYADAVAEYLRLYYEYKAFSEADVILHYSDDDDDDELPYNGRPSIDEGT